MWKYGNFFVFHGQVRNLCDFEDDIICTKVNTVINTLAGLQMTNMFNIELDRSGAHWDCSGC